MLSRAYGGPHSFTSTPHISVRDISWSLWGRIYCLTLVTVNTYVHRAEAGMFTLMADTGVARHQWLLPGSALEARYTQPLADINPPMRSNQNGSAGQNFSPTQESCQTLPYQPTIFSSLRLQRYRNASSATLTSSSHNGSTTTNHPSCPLVHRPANQR